MRSALPKAGIWHILLPFEGGPYENTRLLEYTSITQNNAFTLDEGALRKVGRC